MQSQGTRLYEARIRGAEDAACQSAFCRACQLCTTIIVQIGHEKAQNSQNISSVMNMGQWMNGHEHRGRTGGVNLSQSAFSLQRNRP